MKNLIFDILSHIRLSMLITTLLGMFKYQAELTQNFIDLQNIIKKFTQDHLAEKKLDFFRIPAAYYSIEISPEKIPPEAYLAPFCPNLIPSVVQEWQKLYSGYQEVKKCLSEFESFTLMVSHTNPRKIKTRTEYTWLVNGISGMNKVTGTYQDIIRNVPQVYITQTFFPTHMTLTISRRDIVRLLHF